MKKLNDRYFYNLGYDFSPNSDYGQCIRYCPPSEDDDNFYEDRFTDVISFEFAPSNFCCATEDIGNVYWGYNKKKAPKHLADLINYILVRGTSRYYSVVLQDKSQKNEIRVFKNAGFKQLAKFNSNHGKYGLTMLGFNVDEQKKK